MPTTVTRRDAIRAAMAAAAGAAMFGSLRGGGSAMALAQGSPSPAGARAFVTDSSGRRHAAANDVVQASGGAADVMVSIDTAAPRQTILGFGAALTEASCTVLNALAPDTLHQLLSELYDPRQSSFSVGRLCLGASDYSTTLYSYDDGDPDPTLARFSIDHDRANVLPVLRQARGVRPDLFLFASPWSPPGWMKYGDSMKGGSIKPHYVNVYAQYVVKYLQAYAAAGVDVNAMTIQNEIDADQDGRMPACTWAEETEAEYIVKNLGPALRAGKLPTKLWILDHNYNLSGRVSDQLARPGLAENIDAIAWHGYVGEPQQMSAMHQRYPALPMHWTEGGDEFGDQDITTNWASWANKFATILANGVSSITTWNLALDETGHPNIGPFHCAGMLTVDSKNRQITRNGIYWALAHYARAFSRGTTVLQCDAGKGDMTVIAGRRGDGSLAVVVANDGPAARLKLDVPGSGNAAATVVAVPAKSVTTVML